MLGLLGFNVALYPARVFVEGAWRDSMSHCVTVARLPRPAPPEGSATAANDVNEKSAKEEVWISDVGFGSSPLIPLRYDRLGEEQEGDAEWTAFRFSRVVSDVPADNGTECILLERCARADGQWQKNLLIYLQPQTLAQLVPSCEARTLPALWLSLADVSPCRVSCGAQALQADESAHFNKRILVSVVTDTKRKTLSGARRFVTTTFADGKREETDILAPLGSSAADNSQREKETYAEVLRREFNIALTPDEQRALDLETSKRNSSIL
jgi:arylamine N-acetyltransferase